MAVAGPTVALAFGLVLAGGLCTCLGALVVAMPAFQSPAFLAGALGASSGVMLYVSLLEIWAGNCLEAFVEHAGGNHARGYQSATLMLFAGMAVAWLLSVAVDLMLRCHQARLGRRRRAAGKAPPDGGVDGNGEGVSCSLDEQRQEVAVELPHEEGEGELRACPDAAPARAEAEACKAPVPISPMASNAALRRQPSPQALAVGAPLTAPQAALAAHSGPLMKLGVLSALAIGLHNVPEGVATFTATYASPATGAAMAVAIALHNIPEGVIVAMPIFCATGSRWRGALWAAMSGLAEVIGGLLAFVAMGGTQGSAVSFGVVFGLVAGLMTVISLKELLPMALKFDPDDRVATKSMFCGMALMASSLMLFTISS